MEVTVVVLKIRASIVLAIRFSEIDPAPATVPAPDPAPVMEVMWESSRPVPLTAAAMIVALENTARTTLAMSFVPKATPTATVPAPAPRKILIGFKNTRVFTG